MARKNLFFQRECEIEKTEKVERRNQKRRRKILRTSQEPLLPVVIQLMYRLMWAAILVVWIVEAIVMLEGKRAEGMAAFWIRSSYSVLYTWMFFGGITTALCVLQLIRVHWFGYEEKIYKFADEIPEKEFSEYTRVNPEELDETMVLYEKTTELPVEKKYRQILLQTALAGAGAGLYFLIGLGLR